MDSLQACAQQRSEPLSLPVPTTNLTTEETHASSCKCETANSLLEDKTAEATSGAFEDLRQQKASETPPIHVERCLGDLVEIFVCGFLSQIPNSGGMSREEWQTRLREHLLPVIEDKKLLLRLLKELVCLGHPLFRYMPLSSIWNLLIETDSSLLKDEDVLLALLKLSPTRDDPEFREATCFFWKERNTALDILPHIRRPDVPEVIEILSQHNVDLLHDDDVLTALARLNFRAVAPFLSPLLLKNKQFIDNLITHFSSSNIHLKRLDVPILVEVLEQHHPDIFNIEDVLIALLKLENSSTTIVNYLEKIDSPFIHNREFVFFLCERAHEYNPHLKDVVFRIITERSPEFLKNEEFVLFLLDAFPTRTTGALKTTRSSLFKNKNLVLRAISSKSYFWDTLVEQISREAPFLLRDQEVVEAMRKKSSIRTDNALARLWPWQGRMPRF